MKEEIREVFIRAGAAVCGIAAADAFADMPAGFRPTDVYAGCQSVIVFAVPLPKGTALVNPRIVYGHFNALGPVELDRIAFLASNEIERVYEHAVAVPLPADGPYDDWNPEKTEGRGILSMKHAAVRAGIGTLGKNTLLLNPRYGNMLSIGAVLTNLPLPSDEPAESICIPGCHICVDSCPVQAIGNGKVNQFLCRKHTYETNARGFGVVNCNACRVRCPMAFGKGRTIGGR